MRPRLGGVVALALAVAALGGGDGVSMAAATTTTTTTTAISNDSTGSSSVDGSGVGGTQTNDTRIVLRDRRTFSGIEPWVDPATPADKQSYVTSRGERWELVMSDEFDDPARNFTPGNDHLWTSLEKPDGVNGAVGLYSHNMTYVQCDEDAEGNKTGCYLVLEVRDEVNSVTVYNQYSRPPSFQVTKFFYRSAMLQTWNKFCIQGGMVEVRAQLPGAINARAKNPDLGKGPTARATTGDFYPTWPGIWLMGNLGRAIFSGSTSRMWPLSYNECNPKAFDPQNQRISACDDNPGHGLNPRQGRGAPEIDILEGGGVAISSSIQIGPGLKKTFRKIDMDLNRTSDNKYCFYSQDCVTPGSNLPNVPTAIYKRRGHQTWYKGLRYSANPFCVAYYDDMQRLEQVNASLNRPNGIEENKCTLKNCPASRDVLSDLGYIDGDPKNGNWGINRNGTCFAVMNAYMGSFLCDPDSTDPQCEFPRNATTKKINVMEPFAYQMDALSANWGVHVGAYTGFLTYQVEWVTGDAGYIRWMLAGHPLFEIPAATVVNGPQDRARSNPRLTFPEEPMYIILNVAVSAQWGAKPPNPGKPCRGNGKNALVNRVCDGFPMYMKVDYVRVYQDRSSSSTMSLGCDPKTHPTRQWILDHIKEYQDDVNRHIDVDGGAPCESDLDCTIARDKRIPDRTGSCVQGRCQCAVGYWGGPRCTSELLSRVTVHGVKQRSYGPSLYVTMSFGAAAFVLTFAIMILCTRRRRIQEEERREKLEKMKSMMSDRGDVPPEVEKAALLPSDFEEIELSRLRGGTPQAAFRAVG